MPTTILRNITNLRTAQTKNDNATPLIYFSKNFKKNKINKDAILMLLEE